MLDTGDEIKSFLELSKKSEDELRVICEGFALKTDGTKKELISKLIKLSVSGQADYTMPQAIALRTQENGVPLDGAADLMKKIRGLIFKNGGQRKDFSVLNGKRESYKVSMSFAECPADILGEVLKKNYCLPQLYQGELIDMLKSTPELFTVHLINKPSSGGKNFVMLHCQAKVA